MMMQILVERGLVGNHLAFNQFFFSADETRLEG